MPMRRSSKHGSKLAPVYFAILGSRLLIALFAVALVVPG
jgi:hypothetical protein